MMRIETPGRIADIIERCEILHTEFEFGSTERETDAISELQQMVVELRSLSVR
jgi:hypothetical protein